MQAIILDMYGVIVKDTGDGFYEFVNKTFSDLSVKEIYKQWDRADLGEISSLEVFERLGYTGDLVQIERSYLDTVELMEGFREFASEMKKHYKLALLSNDCSEWSKFLRDKYHLNDCFEVITVSGDVKMKKPDARIYQLTLEKLGCIASECVYIDDRRKNLEAAKALGMDAVLFNTRNVEYDGKVVTNFEELRELLLEGEKKTC